MFEEAIVHINCLNRIQVQFRLLQSSFLCFSTLHNSSSRSIFPTSWGKGGSRCDSCPFVPLFLWTIQAASLTFRYTRYASIKFLWIHVPRLNDAMRIQQFEGFIEIWEGFVPPVTLRLLFWISWGLVPTRLRLLYKAPRGIVLSHFCRFLNSWEIPSSPFLQAFSMTSLEW